MSDQPHPGHVIDANLALQRIAELEAVVANLRERLRIYETPGNDADKLAASVKLHSQRCCVCDALIFVYPCSYCGHEQPDAKPPAVDDAALAEAVEWMRREMSCAAAQYVPRIKIILDALDEEQTRTEFEVAMEGVNALRVRAVVSLIWSDIHQHWSALEAGDDPKGLWHQHADPVGAILLAAKAAEGSKPRTSPP
jgi:hypothetical protein